MKKFLVFMLIAVATACTVHHITAVPTKDVTVKVMVYQKGETLWELIADEMDRVGDPRDIREVIHLTQELNGIGPNIKIGDVIVIPLKAALK